MINQNSPIGVFDSGVGGISVLNELRKLMPAEDFIYYGDSLHAPYGEKSKEEISERCISICEFFKKHNAKAIVIACNTATSACVTMLRDRYADIPIIGMEPALKVAAQRKGKQHILVLATHFTLKEHKFAQLMARYEEENVIYKQPCPKLVELVEQQQLGNEELVMDTLKMYLQPYDLEHLDSVVLGCTHFVFYRTYLENLLPKNVAVIDGNYGTAKHLKEVLGECGLLKAGTAGTIDIYNSMDEDERYITLSKDLIKS